ncbi:MAG: HAD family hydrolase [Methanofollis sp.]|uniref:HAD family hydrolase n=1 Tax=Methanofollis sp. TaxID=2052835 RepID=UPI00261A54B2|nr:HAD family hydrolase [Methanofollis sp.]MDD4254578.1 HAD family hydrolase [Methanofollis sp.]
MSQAPVDFTRVRAVLFDCYDTLLDISTDERGLCGYQTLSTWAAYQGVRIAPEDLRDEYRQRIAWMMAQSTEAHPEVRVEEIFAGICRDYAAWPLDETILGVMFARSFRAATVRKLGAFPRSRRLLSALYGYPLGVVSNGQRVFSEVELRMFGLAPFFRTAVFSSDVGCKKPDDRIFQVALRRIGVEPEEALFIGDSMTNDIIPARRLGMQAIHIREAWLLFSV